MVRTGDGPIGGLRRCRRRSLPGPPRPSRSRFSIRPARKRNALRPGHRFVASARRSRLGTALAGSPAAQIPACAPGALRGRLEQAKMLGASRFSLGQCLDRGRQRRRLQRGEYLGHHGPLDLAPAHALANRPRARSVEGPGGDALIAGGLPGAGRASRCLGVGARSHHPPASSARITRRRMPCSRALPPAPRRRPRHAPGHCAVRPHPGAVGLEGLPGDVAAMVVGDEDRPLLGRQGPGSAGGKPTVGPQEPRGTGTTERERSGVTRIGEHSMDEPRGGGRPVESGPGPPPRQIEAVLAQRQQRLAGRAQLPEPAEDSGHRFPHRSSAHSTTRSSGS